MPAVLLLIALVMPPLKTAPKVDLERYAGTWHEIARLPNWFQNNCSGSVTATYTPNPDGTIQVVNTCRDINRQRDRTANGVARVVRDEAQSNAVLEVRFARRMFSALPFVWGDYRIIEVGPAYEYALVGTNDRKYLWILSRQPTLDRDVYQRLVRQAESQGFETNRLVRTPAD